MWHRLRVHYCFFLYVIRINSRDESFPLKLNSYWIVFIISSTEPVVGLHERTIEPGTLSCQYMFFQKHDSGF